MAKKQGKKEIQRLSQKLAQKERDRRDLQEARNLIDWLRAWAAEENVSRESYKVALAVAAKIRRIAKEQGIDIEPDYVEAFDPIAKDSKQLDKLRAMFDRATELGKKQAMRKHIEEEHSTPKPKMCARCDSREAHFGDVCKHCAEELGIRPTGKV